MKIFYKNSYKLVDGITLCTNCPFRISNNCIDTGNWFNCGRVKLVLDKTQIFDL